MRFIAAYPEFHGLDGSLLDSGPVGEFAAVAEASGWDGFALTEHPIPGERWLANGGHQTYDPFIGLAFAAQATSTLRLFTSITVIPYRNPMLLAKAASTLDALSNGRLTLGVGAGYQKSEFFALGVDMTERNRLFDEALEVLPLAWSGKPFSFKGLHFDARNVISLPPPRQDPIPIWIGGNSQLTMRRVAERAQGWMPLGGPPELAQTTRSPALGSLDDVRRKINAMREAASWRRDTIDLALVYWDHSIWDLTHTDRHHETLAAMEDAGATWITVVAPQDYQEAKDFMAGFGQIYINPVAVE